MEWQSVLDGMDAWTFAMVLVATAFFASSLMATGGVLFSLYFPSGAGSVGLQRSVVVATWFALALLLLQWPLQAGFLGGGTLAAALDPMLLGVVFEGAPGNRTVLVAIGLVLLHGVLIDSGRMRYLGAGLSATGVVLVLFAFTQVGHTNAEPRWLLGGLLLVHLAAVAFWVGALLPLYRMAGQAVPHEVAARALVAFGRGASIAVGFLLVAAAGLSWLLLGGVAAFSETAYGQILLLKIALVLMLLGLAALNKWRLVPAFERQEPNTARRLRQSIAGEGFLVVLILFVTALLTTTASPYG